MTGGGSNTRWKAYKAGHNMFERHTRSTTAGDRPMKCFYVANAMAAEAQQLPLPAPSPDELWQQVAQAITQPAWQTTYEGA